MDWAVLISKIFEVCIIPLLGVLTLWGVSFLKQKSNEIKVNTDNEVMKKYIDMLTETITNCVVSTNQTYVDALKEQGAFDMDAQKEAFSRTYNSVMRILSEEAKVYLTNIFGDLQEYIINKIELEVKVNKNWEG